MMKNANADKNSQTPAKASLFAFWSLIAVLLGIAAVAGLIVVWVQK